MKRSRAAALVLLAPVLRPRRVLSQASASYKIAATAPLTGPFAASSVEYLKGAEIAIAELNRAGGVKGHPLELVVEDTQATPQGGIAACARWHKSTECKPPLRSLPTSLPRRSRWPTNSRCRRSPGSRRLACMPRASTASPMPRRGVRPWNERMVAYWKTHGIKRVYGLLVNSVDGQMKSQAFKTAAPDFGGEYNDSLLDSNGTDFRGVIARAREANPQVILITGQGTSTEAATVKQVREMGVNAPIWSIGQAYASKNFRDRVGAYAEGMVMGGIYLDENAPSARGFVRAYRSQLGFHPGYPAGEFYDIIKMFAYAIDRVGYSGEVIRNAIASLRSFPTVFGGTVTMGADHYTQFSNAGLWRVHNGDLVRLTA